MGFLSGGIFVRWDFGKWDFQVGLLQVGFFRWESLTESDFGGGILVRGFR